MDYASGKIYRMVCADTKRVYIGSTCNTLSTRLKNHSAQTSRCSCNDFINPEIFLIEDYPCDTKEDLLWRERYCIENMDCINKQTPIITEEERREKMKKYRIANAEKVNQSLLEKITCECGAVTTRRNIARHKKRKTHFSLLEQLKQ